MTIATLFSLDEFEQNKKAMTNSPYIPVSQYPSAPDFEMRVRIILGRGIFERLSFKRFMSHVKERDMAIDVGAHVGSWTLGLSKLFNNVISFEPQPTNRQYLEKNLERANAKNVVIYPFAVTNCLEKDYCITANNTTRNSGQAHLIPQDLAKSGEAPVVCVRLDDSLKTMLSTGKINALKIDVEGLELDVLKSGAEIIQAHKPTILLEIKEHCNRYGVTQEEISDYMSDIGYYSVDKHRNDYTFIPK